VRPVTVAKPMGDITLPRNLCRAVGFRCSNRRCPAGRPHLPSRGFLLFPLMIRRASQLFAIAGSLPVSLG